MKNPKLFITGMGGMLGRVLATLAISQNYSVGGTIHKSLPPELKSISNSSLKSYTVDLRDSEETERVIVDFSPNIIVHFAAKTLGRLDKNTANPDIYTENLILFKNILSAVKSLNKPPRFILGTSGCIVYEKLLFPDFITETPVGDLPRVDPHKEPYRAGRLEQEKLIAVSENLEYIITRATQFTGPGKFPGTIEYYIAQQISEILRGKRNNIFVKNKLGEVDMLDVRDVAQAYLTLIRKGKNQNVYHISSGHPVSVGNLAKVFLEAAGLSPREYPIVSEIEEHLYFRFTPEKLKAMGWRPRYSLKDALKSYWEFFRQTQGKAKKS